MFNSNKFIQKKTKSSVTNMQCHLNWMHEKDEYFYTKTHSFLYKRVIGQKLFMWIWFHIFVLFLWMMCKMHIIKRSKFYAIFNYKVNLCIAQQQYPNCDIHAFILWSIDIDAKENRKSFYQAILQLWLNLAKK